MSDILCRWLNQELQLSRAVDSKSFEKDFSTGYLIGEVLNKYGLQEDFKQFSESRVTNSKLNNFTRLEPTLQLLGVQFDENVAQNIMTEKHGSATKLLYQMYIALQKKKKSGLTGVAMQTMRPAGPAKLQAIRSELYRERLKNLMPRETDLSLKQVSKEFEQKCKHMEEKVTRMHFEKLQKMQKLKEEQRVQDIEKHRTGRRRQNEIMARIQAAVIQIPRQSPNCTLKAVETQKMLKKKKEAEDVSNEIQKFEALLKKDTKAKYSDSKTVLDASGQMSAAELLNTYSDDEYIRKIQKRLEEDTLARERREKRRRKLLLEQLMAHEAQEEAYREEQLINRLMRQSQQERRIAVQLMHVRHEKEVLWQNRIFREKQYEERRLKDFQDALDREAALAKQAKIDYEEQALKEMELHEKLSSERARSRYKKHYSICGEILAHIIDLSTIIGEYRMLTNNLIPPKLMRDWKELFFNGKPIYQQATFDSLPAKPTAEQLTEVEKMTLLDEKDYNEYKTMIDDWSVPEEMNANLPPSNNNILGHVLHRLMQDASTPTSAYSSPPFPPFAIKGCILGKMFSGKTMCSKYLEEAFQIQILSVDTLVQEAIQAFHDNEMSSENSLILPEAEGSEKEIKVIKSKSSLSKTTGTEFSKKTPSQHQEVNSSTSEDKLSNLTLRAFLGASSEKLLKLGKSIPDELLVDILVNAINQVQPEKGWIMDGFPMTIYQAKLLEKALTGTDPDKMGHESTEFKKSSLAIDPTATKEAPLPPPAFDFVMLLDISDTIILNRLKDLMDEMGEVEMLQGSAKENADVQVKERREVLRDQVQHRISGFLDTWPSLEKLFSDQQNILLKINAEIDKESLCHKVKETFMAEMLKKQRKGKRKAERKESEKKEEVPIMELPVDPEVEKKKEVPPLKEPPKKKAAKGKPSKEVSTNAGPGKDKKGKKTDTSLKGKGTLQVKSPKKSPTPSEVIPSPVPAPPPPVKPGSEEWVYVDAPLPEEIPMYLVPYWEDVERTYINTIKMILRQLRDEQYSIIYYLSDIRRNFQKFLKRPDHKQEFISQWQSDYNSLPDDLWEDEETKAELHQRVNDLRDRLWDISDTRKEEAEQERSDIINESWLQDHIGILINHFFSLMQVEVDRFQDTKRLLQDYYKGMEGKIPSEESKKFTRIPLLDLFGGEKSGKSKRIPLVARRDTSPEGNASKLKSKPLKGKEEHSFENLVLNYEVDEKTIIDTWQNAVAAISSMVAAEIQLRDIEDEKENQQTESKEKSSQAVGTKSPGKDAKKKTNAPNKKKGLPVPVVEVSPILLTPEEVAEQLKKRDFKFKLKQEHLAALQVEEETTKFRLELIKIKTIACLEELIAKSEDIYRDMEKWLGAQYLAEMSSIKKLTEVAHHHIETSINIQPEFILNEAGFFISKDVKVIPDPSPPPRPPPVEKEVDGKLTISQLNTLQKQFIQVAPKGLILTKTFTDLLLDLVTLNLGSNNIPDAWLHLTVHELQVISSMLAASSETVNWHKFLLVAAQPWPLPTEMELLDTLQRFRIIDKTASGMVSQEEYNQVGLWFKGQEDLKIPDDPTEPLPFNRQEHLIKFFFTLLANTQKIPPKLDYMQMLLYFACHPDATEGVYRALSIATGTHIFRKKEESPSISEKYTTLSSMDQLTNEDYSETEEIPEGANEVKISIATLLIVFQHGGNEVKDNHRFSDLQKAEDSYEERFTKVYKELGADNLEPISAAVLLKHPFIHDLISSTQKYKLPDIKAILQRVEQTQASEGENSTFKN
ncbi:sperm flagellar protein 2 isoform X2 [Ornithorhynchus anatinus]|uniref:Sperm flagellar 2 n=1 Tax=Ornithorhynchus anatinus TaxID=9258 RepID=F7A0K7_ORNAN|nr:sperm flagellar protein 2 isoform X2 [Ornithorhynchus anatinus]